MKLTIAIITDESEKWIGKVIKRLDMYRMLSTIEFLFIDNLSKDNTVPIIVSSINRDFIDEDRYKFYINNKKKTKEEIVDMIGKIATGGKCVIIEENKNKKQIEKMIKEIL